MCGGQLSVFFFFFARYVPITREPGYRNKNKKEKTREKRKKGKSNLDPVCCCLLIWIGQEKKLTFSPGR